ncbi:MAG: hypothetical protein R8K20_03620 [Gallionellaceae bacterium]
MSASLAVRYCLGPRTVEQRMLILVDIERLMSSRDMELMETIEALIIHRKDYCLNQVLIT